MRSEDVDVAIRVLLESFMSTQKYTVQQALRRRFKRFLSRPRDFQDLLMALLRDLLRRTIHYAELQGDLQVPAPHHLLGAFHTRWLCPCVCSARQQRVLTLQLNLPLSALNCTTPVS